MFSTKTYRLTFPFALLGLFFCLLPACISSADTIPLPENFNLYSSKEKAQWLSGSFMPDSLAVLICNNASGKDSTIRFNDFSSVIREVYEIYPDSSRIIFSNRVNSYVDSLPPLYKMKIYRLAAESSPRRLGYEYAMDMSGETDTGRISDEINALKTICKDDTTFFIDFMQGYENGKQIKFKHENNF